MVFEPPCTERYARWCERSVGKLIYSILIQSKAIQRINRLRQKLRIALSGHDEKHLVGLAVLPACSVAVSNACFSKSGYHSKK